MQFPELRKLSLKNYKYYEQIPIPVFLTYLTELILIDIKLKEEHFQLMLNSPALKTLSLQNVNSLPEEIDYDKLVERLEKDNVDVITDNTVPILDEAFF